MSGKLNPKARSCCPVCVWVEPFGDRWSLLIIRDLMSGYRTFREFRNAGEGIATNVLASRLRKLTEYQIIAAEPAVEDRRRVHYRLTRKGIALAPVILELLIWAARHEETAAPCAFIDPMDKNREAVLERAHRRWERRDRAPLIPPFPSPAKSSRRYASR